MHHKLSRATLLRLQEITRENTYASYIVLQEVSENDQKAQALPPPLQAEYLALRRFFDTLIFHDLLGRTFSWINSHRQSYFFCPRVVEEECGDLHPRMSLVVRVTRQDDELTKALIEEGADCRRASEYEWLNIALHTAAALQSCLKILKAHHDGYILPDAATWQAMQKPARGAASRICARLQSDLGVLPQPDCWI